MALVTQADPFEQQRSYNESRKDVLAKYAYFFGDPPHPEKLDLYTDQHALTPHLPDAYAGRSTQLVETINNLVRDAPDNWYTSVMLPFKRMDDSLNVEWNSVTFDRRLMQRVPYEGTSRMLTSMKRSHRDRMVRHGLAMVSHGTASPKQTPLCVFLAWSHLASLSLLFADDRVGLLPHPAGPRLLFQPDQTDPRLRGAHLQPRGHVDHPHLPQL